MSDELQDLDQILTDARLAWEKQQTRRAPIQVRIGNSVPWWLVLIAAVMYGLSAPHTARVFDLITPGVGNFAPLGIEFGLLYAAFYRYQQRGQPSGRTIRFLQGLLIVISVLSNLAGSFVAVVTAIKLADLSPADAVGQLPHLSLIQLSGLVLVPFAALMIPAGTWVAGEGLARLFLEIGARNDRDGAWAQAAPRVEYTAIYNVLITRGVPARRAAVKAGAYVAGKYGAAAVSRPRSSTDTADSTDSHGQVDGQAADTATDSGTDTAYLDLDDPVGYVIEQLSLHPAYADLSVRDLSRAVRVRKSSVGKALLAWRAQVMGTSHNGHHPEGES